MKTVEVRQCNTCGGIYRSHQADGTEYYHACPADVITQHVVVDADTGKITTPEQRAPLANRRDENIGGVNEQDEPIIKADGAGFSNVADGAIPPSLGVTQEGS